MNCLNNNLPFKTVACNLFTPKNRKFLKSGLTVKTKLNYIKSAFNKAPKNERDNSNNLSTAHSTPIFYACFFVHSVYAHPNIDLFSDRLCPMVTRGGKGFALCRFPLITVCHPVARYRQSVTTFAVTLEYLINGVTQMTQFIFAAIRRTDLSNRIQKIRINADTELQARAILAREFVLVLAGKIPEKNTSKFDRTFTQGGIYA
ncbi:host cell division inhibitor Icd-like protein [Necropsobacter rosorum]|uniref:host cell division inhibitor Icd-like protein n=1 Tax=Necropsobacter rosorum TaxID=908285 RepID=UPI000A02F25F